MLKKAIKFVDFDGVERVEDFYFNLTKAELTEMQYSKTGGLIKQIERLISLKDEPKIIAIFKDLIVLSYGEKSPDGRRFIKNEEVLNNFLQTEAYSILYMELATDADKANEFIQGIVPKA